MHQSTRVARIGLAVAAMLAALALAAPAQAAEPAPGFEEFDGCPSPEENPAVFLCTISEITGGHFQMGSKDVPIVNTMTLSGGAVFPTGNLVANSKGGLTPVKQPVPGGVIGLTGLDWLVNFLHLDALKLYAVTELAGAPGSLFAPALKLPIRVHLENPVLGKNCYVGSFESPIILNLTTGSTSPPPPNESITGQPVSFAEDPKERENVEFYDEGIFVDNSFAAPGANGCRLELGLINIPIDELVNFQSGLPAAAGTNETIQEFNLALTEPGFVYP